jgi:aerobic C4-dicarboxylate transport protein
MALDSAAARHKKKKPFYMTLWGQVVIAFVLAVLYGYFFPKSGAAMRPLGDAFIKLITMIITLLVFFTVVSGIAGMQDLRKVGRVGGKALLYFEIVSTIALLIGLAVGNLIPTGAGFNADPTKLNASALNQVSQYAGQAKDQTVTAFLINIIPTTFVNAFAIGNMLQVILVSVLFGVALAAIGAKAKPLVDMMDHVMRAIFGVVNVMMKFAPIGVFGAMAFTVGNFGLRALVPLAKLIATFWATSILFVVIVLGIVCWAAGFSIFKFLNYIKEEIILVLSLSSSEPALPTLMEKMEKLGCSKALVGLVVPTGYTFNTDGSSLYMTLAALFVAQATNTHLTIGQQLTLFAVAVLTSKGASGVQGASFIALVATLQVVPSIPVAGMALILGIDRFMSMFRATVNMVGNGIAALVLARWENELDAKTIRKNLEQPEPSAAAMAAAQAD